LRVKDIDFAYNQIVVRDGKGQKDRVVPLPQRLVEPLLQHLGMGSRTCSLRIMFRDLSHTAWARGISQSYTLPTSFQSPCPPLCPSLYAHPSRSLPRSSTGILC